MKKRLVIIGLCLFLIIGGVYIVCFTNIIFNHSCVGITYASTSETFGIDLILRYFDNEQDAKKLYKAENIDTYYLVAVDADNMQGYKNTEEWFRALQAPLVDDNVKYISTSAMDSFAEENELMLYSKGSGLDDGYIGSDELDNTYDLYKIGIEWMSISDNCTDTEKDFYLKHCGLAFSLQSAFDNYEISLKCNDEYSASFWGYQITDLCNGQIPTIPSTKRDSVDWVELNDSFSRYLSVLIEKSEKISASQNLDESDWSLINSTTLAYAASIISLNRDLNSDSIVPIENENQQSPSTQLTVNYGDPISFEGTILRNDENFPEYCLKLNKKFSITLVDGDMTENFVCDTLYFYQDTEYNGGYDFSRIENKNCTVTASLENYRGGGDLYLLNPIIAEGEKDIGISFEDAFIEIIGVRPCKDGMYSLTVDYKIENIQNVRGCVYLKCDAHAFTTQMFFNDENHLNEYREDGNFSYNIGWQNDNTTKSLIIRYGYGDFDPNIGWTKECKKKIYYRLVEDCGKITSPTIPQNEIFDIYDGEQYIGAWTLNQNGDLIESDGNSVTQPFAIHNTFTSESGNKLTVTYVDHYIFSINDEVIGTADNGLEVNDALLFQIDSENGTYLITRYPKDEYVSVGVAGFIDASIEGKYYP